MKHTIRRILALLGVMTVLFSMSALPAAAAEYSEDGATFSCTMTDLEDVKKHFGVYYLPTTLSRPMSEDISAHWQVKDDMLQRVGDIDPSGTCDKTTVLVLRGYMFANFEASFTFKMGTANWGWLAFAFRQQQPGGFFINDGNGVYLDANGDAWNWGFRGDLGNNKGSRVENFRKDTPYRVRVRVFNNNVKMYVDDNLVLDQNMPSDFLYEGYVSIQVCSNDSSVSDFEITKLDGAGGRVPFLPVEAPVTTQPPTVLPTQPPVSNNPTTAPTQGTTAQYIGNTTLNTLPATTTKAGVPDELENEDGGADWLLIVAIAAGAVVLLGGAVGLGIVLGKKKA